MNSIKTYLLPLILLLFFSAPVFAQCVADDAGSKEVIQMSNTDSILVNHYFTEREYNRIHGINQSEKAKDSEYMYEDEIYRDKKHKKRGRDTFLSDIPAEAVVDIVINTLFFVAILWQ